MPINGRLQVGMGGIDYFTVLWPYANIWKVANFPVVVAGGVDYSGALGPGKALSPWGVYLDANGDLADPMDAAITEYRRLWYENTLSTGSLIGRNMVLVFTGTATTVSFDGSPTNISRVGNRVTFTVASDSTNRVKFSGFTDLNDPPRVTYLCFAEDEAAVLANPLALSRAYYNDLKDAGIVRFMDAMSTNSSRALLRYTDIATPDYCKWGSAGREGGLKVGLPLAAVVSACNELQSHCYFNIPNRLGVGKSGAVSAVTLANPGVVSSYPLPANGDEVIFYKMLGLGRTFTCTADATTDIFTTVSGNHNLVEDQAASLTGTIPAGLNIGGARTGYYVKVLSPTTFQLAATRGGAAINFTTNGGTITVTIELECDKFTVANVNAGAGTFELSGPGSDTSLLSAFVSGSTLNQWCTKFDLDDIEAEVVPVLEYLRDNLDPGLRLHLTYGNETFNSGANFDQFYVLRSQARHSWVTVDSHSTMYGYMLGLICKLANDVYGTEGRHRWRGVLEIQTANLGPTPLYIDGLEQAVTDFASPMTVGDLCYYGAVTSYYGESMIGSANGATLDTWIDDSITANISDPATYPTQYTQFVTKLGEEAYNGAHSLPGDSIDIVEMPALWEAQQDIFQAAGINKMTMYEGGVHIVVSQALYSNLELIDFVNQYYGSAAHATNIQQSLALWDLLDDVEYPSQYLSHTSPSRSGGWGARNEIGVDTPVSDVYASYNTDNLIRTRYSITTTP